MINPTKRHINIEVLFVNTRLIKKKKTLKRMSKTKTSVNNALFLHLIRDARDFVIEKKNQHFS